MDNIKKLTIVMIRLQALAIILMGLIQWGVVAGMILISSLKAVPTVMENYEAYIISSIFYFLVGFILWVRSKSLASYFIGGLQNND
jgi:hypothetical protein